MGDEKEFEYLKAKYGQKSEGQMYMELHNDILKGTDEKLYKEILKITEEWFNTTEGESQEWSDKLKKILYEYDIH